MTPLVIYYTPGARGDFVSRVLGNSVGNINFKVNGSNYIKLHNHTEFSKFNQSRTNEYVVRISTNTPQELIDTTLLHFIKNQTKITYNYYDLLFIVAKNSYYEQQQSDKFNYSYKISFNDLYDIEKLDQLYYNYTEQHLSNNIKEYISANNLINIEYINRSFEDENVKTVLNLLDFEIRNNCFKLYRKFTFDEYLNNAWQLSIADYRSEPI